MGPLDLPNWVLYIMFFTMVILGVAVIVKGVVSIF
jgi:hypothetical protein